MIGTLKSAMPWFLCCSLLARPWARHLRAIDSSRFSCVSGFWWISKLSSGWAARARGSGRLCTALGYCSVRASGVQAGKQTTLEVKVKVTRWPVPVRCSTEPCRHSFSCCLIQHFLQLSFFFYKIFIQSHVCLVFRHMLDESSPGMVVFPGPSCRGKGGLPSGHPQCACLDIVPWLCPALGAATFLLPGSWTHLPVPQRGLLVRGEVSVVQPGFPLESFGLVSPAFLVSSRFLA